MSDNVTQFPAKPAQPPLLSGPFDVWHVIVKGRRIPLLTGRYTEDGGINFIVDDRFMGGPFYGETAYQAAHLLAQALAVASGYSHLEAPDKTRGFAPVAHHIGEMPDQPHA